MSAAVEHAASIAIAKLKADGRIDDLVSALLTRIDELEAEADDIDLEVARLRHFGNVMEIVFDEKQPPRNWTLDNASRACELVDGMQEALRDAGYLSRLARARATQGEPG